MRTTLWLGCLLLAFAGISTSPAHGFELDQITIDAPKGTLALDIARNPEERMHGLMGVPRVPKGRGMLFLYDPPQEVRLWMLNMRVPLDLVYLRDGHVIKVIRRSEPCLALPCPIYSSGALADAAIELGAGQAKAMGLVPGTRIDLSAA